MNIHMDVIIKLGISAILGLVIGLERELRKKPIGLKTCLVISIVSCLLTIVSIESAYIFPKSDIAKITMDPLRLAAQIVSGIGFIGAGVILRRENDSIAGLTTAAMIWGASGLGIGVGAGFYTEAIIGMLMVIFSVELIPVIIKMIGPKKLTQSEILLSFVVENQESMNNVLEQIQILGYKVGNVKIKQLSNLDHSLQMRVSVQQHIRTPEVYYAIQQIDNVKNIELEKL
ncbi:MAG: MgtC/SapB family protein [Bacillaceae bacterium]